MTTPETLKTTVREKYDSIARRNTSGCCGSADAGGTSYTTFSEDYTRLEGYLPDADLGLGCGIPTGFAGIKEGDTVLDLGSGAGNDVFVARSITGSTGFIIGVDFAPAMLEKAETNRKKLGYDNVEFRHGEIEALPVEDRSVDVVISNCVLNLVPDKKKAFAEIHRVLKPGGTFSVSDIVLQGELPPGLKEAAEMYAGCVSGAIPLTDYLEIVQHTGFDEVEVLADRPVSIPANILAKYLDNETLAEFKASGAGVRSVTVRARK